MHAYVGDIDLTEDRHGGSAIVHRASVIAVDLETDDPDEAEHRADALLWATGRTAYVIPDTYRGTLVYR